MLAIKGIRVTGVSVTLNKEDGSMAVSGSYELVSSKDTVLAKQGFNGYDSIKVDINQAELQKIMQVVQKELEARLGFGGE